MVAQPVLDRTIGLTSLWGLTVSLQRLSVGHITNLQPANGSGRKPASYNGCFGIRPSTGIMNTDGVIGKFP
jgi:hypothetical protein